MSQVYKTDVCIIGAGPSGAATSLMLTKLKIPHYIVDKSIFPRDKTCGDGLILYAYKAMKILGEELFSSFLEHPKFLHSNKVRLHINSNVHIDFKESENRNIIITYAKRIDFDYFLVHHLSNTYASKDFGNGVKEIETKPDGISIKLKNGKEIFSKIVVGADGAKSIVSRKLAKNKLDSKLMSTFISAYFKDVENIPLENEAEIRLIYKKTLLFFYIFPLIDGQVNVSIGGRSDLIKNSGINLVAEIEDIIKTNKNIKNKFANATKVGSWRGGTIPFYFGNKNIIGDRFLLVGDAAGLANAFYKEGVGTGMMSGIIAAKNIERCLEDNNFSKSSLKKYEADLHKEFGKLLKFSHFSLRMARFKSIFLGIVILSKKIIQLKSYKIIKKRSY
ncbi:NAD(P)/FAD-dependent oxidoreductase [Polaribacter sp. IC073]|uniref:NAD(P)/FAD-dependent oxidoreductase n=1 Tax=Polaribacter sp. IC073 TaxID=2508540 RepID=UPI0011BE477D|nr:NAD(P)/FAD-dependent oxidoreductase [Polaribacter sp. IC073]TXD49032.1 NAD(P)/FAD-dependent oxidoreductase [Polaribacter sp. IC073]